MLEQDGYQTSAVASALVAVQKLQTEEFHIVLCDYSLEEKHTGLEVIELARWKNRAMPCILLTGHANQETVQLAEKAGVGVLLNPIDIEEFLAAIPAKLRESNEHQAAAKSR